MFLTILLRDSSPNRDVVQRQEVNMAVKNYILDTNVLLSDTSSLYAFEDNNVVIPLIVLEELDRHKSRHDEVGKNARQVARELDSLRQMGNLLSGVRLNQSGASGLISIASAKDGVSLIPIELRSDKADNFIIALAYEKSRDPESAFVLVSKDINVRIKCDALGIPSEDYLKMRVTTDKENIYRGVMKLDATSDIISTFHEDGGLAITAEIFGDTRFFPNQFVVLKDETAVGGSRSAISRVVEQSDKPFLRPLFEPKDVFGLLPKNKEQKFAIDLLFDDGVKLVTLLGPAGTGKTLIACAAGLQQVQGVGGGDSAIYNKLIITRPIQPLGKDIGFLPGTLEEKMEPWISPLKDSLNFLFGNKGRAGKRDESMLALHIQKKRIEVEALTYIRGRSIPGAFIIIDEAQNLSVHELKTIVTRVSEGTKIILTGDIEQIDNTHVDAYTNGLTYAIEKFKVYDIAGHVSLIKGERSQLATLASKIL